MVILVSLVKNVQGKKLVEFSNTYNGQLFFILYMYFNFLNSLLYLSVKRIDKNNFSLFQQFNVSSWSKNNFVSVDS